MRWWIRIESFFFAVYAPGVDIQSYVRVKSRIHAVINLTYDVIGDTG